MGRNIASGLALIMAAILLFSAFSSTVQEANSGGSTIQQSTKEENEAVVGVVFLIAAFALFKSSTKKAPNTQYKVGSEVSVFDNGELNQGKILASAEDDTGRYAYEIQVVNKTLGAPVKWYKSADVFMPTRKDTEASA
jgi:hypothetical protein